MDSLQCCNYLWAAMRLILLFTVAYCYAVAGNRDRDRESFSYHKFSGPVSGQIQEVYVQDGSSNKGHAVDYIAKPDYTYSYGIEDPHTGNSQTHEESRQGDNVQGEYRVFQPDGLIRIVRYIADPERGFQVDVQYKPYDLAKNEDDDNDH